MRVMLGSGSLLGALLNPNATAARLLDAWPAGRFVLVTSAEQLLELGNAARRPPLRGLIVPANVARFINDLRELAQVITRLPVSEPGRPMGQPGGPMGQALPLAMAAAGRCDYLVSSDRQLLSLKKHGATHIVTALQLLDTLYSE
jgi:predicted nucleic acid-binding protein